jgi:hypothetical protein
MLFDLPQKIGDKLVRWSMRHDFDPIVRVLERTGLRRHVLAHPLARRVLQRPSDQEWSVILNSRPCSGPATGDVELHMLVCERDALRAIWALKSFYHFSGLNPRLRIHDDGSLSPESRATLKSHFPSAELTEDAVAQGVARLEGFPMCQFFRRKHPISGKLLDVLLLARAPYVIVMDADVLWFGPSQTITDAVTRGQPFFLQARSDSYARNRHFLEAHCNLFPARGVNSGIIGYVTHEMRDWDFLEKSLSLMVNIPSELVPASLGYQHRGNRQRQTLDPIDSITWWVMEQTLYALLFGRTPNALPLPRRRDEPGPRHLFHGELRDSRTALQHFISDGAWNKFFPVGVAYLLSSGFLEAWRASATPSPVVLPPAPTEYE